MSRGADLALRRRELVERSTAQRAALIADAQPLLGTAARLDSVVSSLRRYPVVIAVAAGAVAFFGSRKLFDLATRAITLYALFKR